MGQLMVKAVNNYDQTSVFSILSRAAIFSLTLSWIESISLYTSCKKMHIITNINMQSFRGNKNLFYSLYSMMNMQNYCSIPPIDMFSQIVRGKHFVNDFRAITYSACEKINE